MFSEVFCTELALQSQSLSSGCRFEIGVEPADAALVPVDGIAWTGAPVVGVGVEDQVRVNLLVPFRVIAGTLEDIEHSDAVAAVDTPILQAVDDQLRSVPVAAAGLERR